MSEVISAELRSLMLAQEHFDALRERWVLAAGREGADLAYPNPYEGPLRDAREALRATLEDERTLDLQYTPYGGATIARRLVAQRAGRRLGARVRHQDVLLTPGGMAALKLALRASRLEGRRNEVLIPTPCWLDTPLYAEELGMSPRLVPTRRPGLRLDLDAIAEALTPESAALVLNQPDNPSGVVHTEEELAALSALLDEHEARHGRPLLLIADECHAEFLPEGRRCPSPLAHRARSVQVYSFGKALLMQGQRLGSLVVAPTHPERVDFARTLVRLCRACGHATPTALMQRALPRLLALPAAIAPIMERRARLARALEEAGYELSGGDATMFVYARAPIDDDLSFAARLAAERVLVAPSSLFHHRGWFRLAATADEAMVERALPVLARAREEG